MAVPIFEFSLGRSTNQFFTLFLYPSRCLHVSDGLALKAAIRLQRGCLLNERYMLLHRNFLNARRQHGASLSRFDALFVGATSVTAGAALVLAVVAGLPAYGRTTEDAAQIANNLATMLRSGRTVISRMQDRINDPNIGNKGIDGKWVLVEAGALYQQSTKIDPITIDPSSLNGQLIRSQMDSIAEVIEVHQATLNRPGVGFKGFIPAVFSRLVNEAFGRRAQGVAEMKVTAPPQLVRNPKVQPDEWELNIIQTKLQSSAWPKGEAYTVIAPKNGTVAMRTLLPEYYGQSCLGCHGSPKGEVDITGFPKEGAHVGDLGGVISITLYR
jgi:hypothetical protein